MNPASKEAVSSALEYLQDESKKTSRMCRWSGITLNGKRSNDVGPCYASIYPCPGNKKTNALAVQYLGESDHELVYSTFLPEYGKRSEAFLDFLLGPDSPWRSTIVPHLVTKDPHEVHDQRGFVFEGLDEINHLLLLNFLVASRMPAEFHRKYAVFQDLLESDVPKFESYMASQVFYKSASSYSAAYQGGHEPFSSLPVWNLIDRLRSGEPNGISRSFYSTSLRNPNSITGAGSFYSSPFYSPARRDGPIEKFLLDLNLSNRPVSLRRIKEYASLLASNGDTGETSLSKKIKGVETTSRIKKAKINKDDVEPIEELDF